MARITTGSDNIIIGDGPSNEGVWHRAVMVAVKLHDAGLWNGEDRLTLHNPYQLHQDLFGVQHRDPHSLEYGVDYEIEGQSCSFRINFEGHDDLFILAFLSDHFAAIDECWHYLQDHLDGPYRETALELLVGSAKLILAALDEINRRYHK